MKRNKNFYKLIKENFNKEKELFIWSLEQCFLSVAMVYALGYAIIYWYEDSLLKVVLCLFLFLLFSLWLVFHEDKKPKK